MNEQQAQQLIKDTFEASFDKDRFNGFVRNLLNHIEDAPFTYQGNYIPEKFRQYIKTLERIGKFSDGEHSLDILVITLQKETSLERARTMQRNFIAWYLNGSRGGEMKDAALAAFVSPDQEDWRFSLVKMDYKFEKDKTGKMKAIEKFTSARRWSFLVGVNEKSHTAQSRLVKILANDEHAPTLAELEEAFNIETVTKEFFLKYRKLFIRTKEELDRVVENDPKVKADFDAKGVDTVNFAKKLLGQIIFLYFLQKKGWFGVGRDDDWGTGSKHFLRGLFNKECSTGIPACDTNTDKNVCATDTDTDKNVCATKNFFNDILEPLFYDALARDKSDIDHWNEHFKSKIPFLNGGLFDPIGNYDWVHTDINLPNDLFSNTRKTKEGDTGDGILDVFDRYNFTVREDEPLEKEVAIDPELLGKAYEKFNAIRPDNFADFTKALKSGRKGEENKFNKKFGVYYTPREIVHYMCQQSLINYLYTKVTQAFLPVGITKQDIEDLIEVGETIIEHEATALIKEQNIKKGIQKSTGYTALLSDGIRKNAKIIDDWLADITVCDPAAGSGAFPVGMMNEIVRARNVLSVFLQCNTGIPACGAERNTDIPVCDSECNTGIPACDSDSIHKTRRNLPHWTKSGSIYWVTFRLADSLSQEKLNIWKAEQDDWTSRHPEPWSPEEWEEYNERFGERLEKWFDAGYGSCVLSRLELRKIVKDSLLRFDGERLHVHAAVIMPNHVHLLIEPLAANILSELLKGIKGTSARKINQLLGKTGTKFWMDESYDHIVRSEAQYHHFIKYIFDNPAKADLSQDKYWLYQCNTDIPACDSECNTGIPACGTDKNVCATLTLRSSYEFKRRCIEHSLYGVDIDPGAVEIAKLRLWLSLVVDEEDIKNIKPLPNLDYKIMQGNSLISEFMGINFDDEPEKENGFKFKDEIDDLIEDFQKKKGKFLNESNVSQKEQLKGKVEQLLIEIFESKLKKQKGDFFKRLKEIEQKYSVLPNKQQRDELVQQEKEKLYKESGFDLEQSEKQLKEFTSGKQIKPFFLWKLYFSEVFHNKGGFDVVIANPPYVVAKKNELKHYIWIKGNQNTYVAFLELAYNSINESGSVSYIIPSTWLAGNNFKILRMNLLKKKIIQQLIQLPYDIFDAAYVDNVIVILTGIKVKNNKVKTFKFKIKEAVFSEKILHTNFEVKDWINSPDSVIYLDSHLHKFLSVYQNTPHKLLGEIAEVQRGTLPPKQNEMFEHFELRNNNNFIKWFTGQIYRYTIKNGPDKYVVYDELRENKRREVFLGDRIIGRQLISRQFRMQFTFTDKIFAFKKNLYAIYNLKKEFEYGYLLSLLNSRLYSYIQVKLNASGQRDDYPAFSLKDYRNFRIPIVSMHEQKAFGELSYKILSITKSDDYLQNPQKQARVKELEREIDQMVYQLYGLTEEEIRIVEGEGK